MHAEAALTPRARLELGRLVVLDKVTVADPARRFRARTGARTSVTPSCTPSSTTTAASPTPRSTTTRPAEPPPPSCAAPCCSWPPAASSIQRVLTDNGGCYRSRLWRQQCQDLDVKHERTRPYRPQTNGKVERFHRTLTAGWAFRRLYRSESARRNALPTWLHEYNHHRLHSAIGRTTPISRLTNLPGQYS